MRRVATAVLLAIAMVIGVHTPGLGQTPPPPNNTPTPVETSGGRITPFGFYVMGSVFVAAAAPIIGTIVLGREMTAHEVYRSTLASFLGPAGWLLGNQLFPDAPRGGNPPVKNSQAHGRNINIPPLGEIHFVPNEILVEFDVGTNARYLDRLARSLQLTQLDTQTFVLTGRTLQRWRIDGTRSVPNTLRVLSRFARISSAQANFSYLVQQGAPASTHDAASDATAAQYVISKLHLLEAHRITNGDDVLVAVLDSQIDTKHPDLTGVFADEYDVLGTTGPAHLHGTGMAGAIAAHTKLLGVAPKVKLLAVRAFTGDKESAQSTTYNILKGLDWAAGKGARVINMSFAGPADPMFHNMLAKAHGRGIVLIAAVGNAGPNSPPLYPAADPYVIGVTATDADDKLLPQANRGPQVAISSPGVDVLVPAPDGGYQITSGTSVAAAHVSGVAALLLARNPKLTPDEIRRVLIRTAHAVPGKRNDTGAGVIDALSAVDSTHI
jgi:subtilisin family serine protease